MRGSLRIVGFVATSLLLSSPFATLGDPPDPAAVERGRVALTSTGLLEAGLEWRGLPPGQFALGRRASIRRLRPTLTRRRSTSDTAFTRLRFPTTALPMGLRRAGKAQAARRRGSRSICMVSPRRLDRGHERTVGLGNSTRDMRALLYDLTRADNRRLPPSLFHLNLRAGTVNAGMISAVLLSLRNSDLSMRSSPFLWAPISPSSIPHRGGISPQVDHVYYDGRTDARSVRSILQFFLAEKSARRAQGVGIDVSRYPGVFQASLQPPKYPFPIDAAKAERGKVVFADKCVKCHGTYGPNGHYPNVSWNWM